MDDQARVLIAVTISVAAVVGMLVLAVLCAVKGGERGRTQESQTAEQQSGRLATSKRDRSRDALNEAHIPFDFDFLVFFLAMILLLGFHAPHPQKYSRITHERHMNRPWQLQRSADSTTSCSKPKY